MGIIYHETIGTILGSVDEDGAVWQGNNQQVKIGDVKFTGEVWEEESFFTEKRMIGYVDIYGIVWKGGEGFFTPKIAIGHIDEDGKVWKDNKKKKMLVGFAHPPRVYATGAALLLLFENE